MDCNQLPGMGQRETECAASASFFRDVVSSERIRRHIMALEGVRHPMAAPRELERAADYFSGSLRAMGYDMAEHLFPDNGSSYRNIIATRPGLQRPDERVVVLAHYDTVSGSPGADDNASGVAVLLEAAEVLSRFAFERTLHFIGVCLEENENQDDPESGTRGSRALAASVRKQGWEIEGVFVLESVGYAGNQIIQSVPSGVAIQVPEFGNFVAVVGNDRSRELIDGFVQAVERYRADLPHVALAVPGNGELLPDSRRSDHASFWDEGFKAVMVTDTTNFRNPHYHRATDTLATLNIEFATKVCCAATGAALELARLVM